MRATRLVPAASVLALAFLFLAFVPGDLPAQSTYVHAGTLIDGKADEPRSRVTIVVEDDRIAAVEDGFVEPGEGDRLVDLSDAVVMPGQVAYAAT